MAEENQELWRNAGMLKLLENHLMISRLYSENLWIQEVQEGEELWHRSSDDETLELKLCKRSDHLKHEYC